VNKVIRYKYKRTGKGIIDNLGAQLEKVVKGSNQCSIATRYRYIEAGERFIRFAAENFRLKKLQNIQNKHIEAYVKFLKVKGRADKYIKNELSAVRYIHRQIPQTSHVLDDGNKANKKYGLQSTPDGRAERAWTEQEIEKMKAKAYETGNIKIAQVVEAARATGMRLDEAASLRRHEVENALQTATLRLKNTKGGRPRDIPLSPRAIHILGEAIKILPRGGYVFTPENKKVHEFKKIVQDFICKHRDKIQDKDRLNSAHNITQESRGALSFHGLRHSFAREFLHNKFEEKLESGLNKESAEKETRLELAEVLGHGREEVTYIYAPN